MYACIKKISNCLPSLILLNQKRINIDKCVIHLHAQVLVSPFPSSRYHIFRIWRPGAAQSSCCGRGRPAGSSTWCGGAPTTPGGSSWRRSGRVYCTFNARVTEVFNFRKVWTYVECCTCRHGRPTIASSSGESKCSPNSSASPSLRSDRD